MNVYCYMRSAQKPHMTCEEQAEQIRQAAETRSFQIVDTGNTALDSGLLGLLLKDQKKIQQAVITFRE